MVASLTAIVVFEVIGDLIQKLAGLPIPGPVIGMALLLAALIFRGRLPDELDRAATGILFYLPMLFVPAGVGVMAHVDLIRTEWPALALGIVGSSILAVAVTALTMCTIERAWQAIRETRRHAAPAPATKVSHEPDVP
jgi:holin-like protein